MKANLTLTSNVLGDVKALLKDTLSLYKRKAAKIFDIQRDPSQNETKSKLGYNLLQSSYLITTKDVF